MWEHESELIEEARRARFAYGRPKRALIILGEVAAVAAIVFLLALTLSWRSTEAVEPAPVVSKIEQDKLEARRAWKEQLCAHYKAWLKTTNQTVNPMEKGCL